LRAEENLSDFIAVLVFPILKNRLQKCGFERATSKSFRRAKNDQRRRRNAGGFLL